MTRKLTKEGLSIKSKKLEVLRKILEQKKDSKNKIYSVHEPEVCCIAKGKEHKKYEFGSKVSILISINSGIIAGIMNFQRNPYDDNTLEAALEQSERLRGVKTEKAIVDEGYRGRAKINETEILRVQHQVKKGYTKRRWEKWFRRRASVEEVISHLKSEHRMGRNYLAGIVGDCINLALSSVAYNFKKADVRISFYFSNF